MGARRQFGRNVFALFFVLTAINWISPPAYAASVTLTWVDNSTNEDGFNIERSVSGSYAQLASVGPNIQSYTDTSVVAGTTYCYRVSAFNSYGVSSPSNESCATIPITTFTLNLTKSGTGSGTVTSSPAGINCGTGSACTATYSSGTVVSLTAIPASGSTFVGWSGDADCLDGNITMTANKTCTATFTLNPSGYALTVSIVSTLSNGGTGSGTVTSSPAGINCGTGSACTATYSSGTVVSLTAIPASGSVFAGWSGDTDCLDGIVTLNTNKSCAATFNLNASTTTTTLSILRMGDGTISSSPSGINCGNQCSQSYAAGTSVTLTATPGQGAKFVGWSGGSCQGVAACTVSLAGSTSVNATFVNPAKIGIFRPGTGQWFLDTNGNGTWDGCNASDCPPTYTFGSTGDPMWDPALTPGEIILPVTGDWTGSGVSNIGVFRPSTGEWFLDLNGNGVWDGCNIDLPVHDLCLHSVSSGLPIAGDWSGGSGVDRIGELVFSGRTPNWYLDENGDYRVVNDPANGIVDCNSDICFKFIASNGDLPVAGDWNRSGTSKVGIFRPSTGAWYLDLNGDGQWKNCPFELCAKSFGLLGDQPIAGDWTGNGTAKIGIYRPGTGQWFLDLNGNRQWPGSPYSQFPIHQKGDLPVVGVW